MTIDELLWQVVEHSRKSSQELADELGVSYSTFRRMLNPEDSYNFPLSLVIPLCLATKDTRLLEHLARRLGRVVYKLPRIRGTRGEENEVMSLFSAAVAEAMKSLQRFFAAPTVGAKKAALDALYSELQANLITQKTVKGWEQLELPLKEEL